MGAEQGSLEISIHMDLPNVEETFVDLNIRDFKTNQEDIRSLNLPIEGKNLDIPAFIEECRTFNLKGNFQVSTMILWPMQIFIRI